MDSSLSAAPTFAAETTTRLRKAFECARNPDSEELTSALNAMCTEAHHRRMSAQAIEIAMRQTWSQVSQPADISDAEWSRAYYAALGRCLTSYYASPI